MDNIDGENYDEGNYDEGSYEEGAYEEAVIDPVKSKFHRQGRSSEVEKCRKYKIILSGSLVPTRCVLF